MTDERRKNRRANVRKFFVKIVNSPVFQSLILMSIGLIKTKVEDKMKTR
jgi:hypothetical protein